MAMRTRRTHSPLFKSKVALVSEMSLSRKIVPARIVEIRHIVNPQWRIAYAEKAIYRTSDYKGAEAG